MTNSQIATEIRKEAKRLDNKVEQANKAALAKIVTLKKEISLIEKQQEELMAIRWTSYALSDAADILEDEKGLLDEDLE